MPQISQLAGTYFSQIFWMLVFFGLTFFVVGRGMVPKVMTTMTDRNQRIAADLAAAEAARSAAEAEQESWGENEAAQRAKAHELITAAKHQAAVATQTSLAAASARIEAQVSSAEGRINAARDASLGEIEHVAAEVAQDIALRVAGLSISAEEARGAVKGAFVHG
ncbi:ATPase [Novosphingobium sp.]|uniref:F0F1 ATP synthase subunit B family protein n=1 Tax=Novosphingobium sp. TaxID=1874826 RepID=UPI00333EE00A